MADINPDVIGLFAKPKSRQFYGTWGKVTTPYFHETLASLNGEVAAIGIIRARTTVLDFRYKMAALGAGTGIKIGYVEIDDPSVNDDDAFATEADTSSATNGRGDSFSPITFENDVYVIVTETGDADASGKVEFLPDLEYLGGK